jgi:hypothetical protein
MQSSPLPCYLIPLTHKYPLHHHILENRQPTFLPKYESLPRILKQSKRCDLFKASAIYTVYFLFNKIL